MFFARLLPEGTTLQLTGGRTRTLPPSQDVEDAWNRWIDGEPRLPSDYYEGLEAGASPIVEGTGASR
jgi:hypothetical protein